MSVARLACVVTVWAQVGVAVAAGQAAAPTRTGEVRASASTVRGRVVEASTGAPVPGALVRAIDPPASALTDADGRFALEVRAGGAVTLQVVMMGFALLERSVDAASPADVVFALTEAPPTYAEQVIVRADALAARDVAAPVELAIGAADLALLRGVLADDPFRAVQAMPGVVGGDDFSAEFSIRGDGPDQIGVSVDGVPAPVVLHTLQGRNDTASVSMLNSDVLDGVAVASGSVPARLGNRTGAQVAFSTRDGSRERAQFRGLVGVAVASLVGEGPLAGGRGSWLVAGRTSYAGWIARRIEPSTDTTFVFLDVNAKLAWDASPAHRLSVLAVAGRMDVEERDQDSRINVLDEGLNESALLVGSWRWQLSPRAQITQHVTGLYNRFRNLNPFGEELGRGRITGGGYRASASWAATDRYLLEAGGSFDVQHDELRLTRINTRPPATTLEATDGTDRISGFFAQVTSTPRRAVTWTAGARGDVSQLAGKVAAGPWGSVAWDAASTWRLRAGSGLYHQFPGIAELAGRRAGTDLDPVGALHGDILVEHRWRPDVRWQVGVYARRERDGLRLPDSEPRLVNGRLVAGSTTTRWANRLDTTSRGIELLVQRRVPVGVSGWLSYAYAITRDRDVVSGERFAGDFDQPHTFNAYVSWRLSHRTGASARYRYGSGLPMVGYYDRAGEDADGDPLYRVGAYRNASRLPAYARLDLRLQRAFVRGTRRFTVFAEAVNLLNRENFGPGGPGRAESLFPVIPSAGLLIEF